MKILNFNVEGLVGKLTNHDFVDFLKEHDLICLTETHVGEDFKLERFNEYDVYSIHGKKLSKQGRRSGGLLVLVKKCFSVFCKQIAVSQPNFIVLELSKELFAQQENTICIFCYLPPVDSPAYDQSDLGVGIELLENCVADLYSNREDFSLFICGDFNARTGQMNSKFPSADASENEEIEHLERSSQDSTVNGFGKNLLSFCEAVGCSILNGAKEFNFDDHETYISATGSSLIDYFIISNELCSWNILHSLKVLSGCIESNHLPVLLTLKAVGSDSQLS
jgi:exonuclease III